ncbi:hypothetical protein NQ317_015460 [Molorchus minor]|uniref:SPT2 homolog N-terminal domain-containing protein n=1 Tax=Molorchus minor TaxID=1323400 RepID=A0ABQ9JTU9_9CUCU|nr:hypothetical protein NQ317_015460 [Molorchus minor]
MTCVLNNHLFGLEMDFGQLLHTAQRNGQQSKNGVRCYSTKFEPPKKEKKAAVELCNIKKFLEKKEIEEKRKAEEVKKKREELLSLRSQDKKATRRVNVMLKRTKSANQSVIKDAIDNVNTAVTLAGPMQPDEDDYGYVSQEASAFYNKMMEKYSKMPDEPKFNMTKKKVSTNLSGTKDRVRAALEKEKEEAMMPHKRKRKHKDGKKETEEDEEGISYEAPDRGDKDRGEEKYSAPPPPKKPRPPPPSLNFAELLKIAEKKQFEPIVIEKKEKDDEKLLTKRQKKEMEKERESLQRREARREAERRGLVPPEKNISSNRIPKIGEKSSKPDENDRIPKLNGQKPLKSGTDDRISKLNNTHPSAKPNSLSKPSTSASDIKKPPPKPLHLDRSDKFKSDGKPSNTPKPSKNPMPSSSNTKSNNRDQENVRQYSNVNGLKEGKPRPFNSIINSKPKRVSSKRR